MASEHSRRGFQVAGVVCRCESPASAYGVGRKSQRRGVNSLAAHPSQGFQVGACWSAGQAASRPEWSPGIGNQCGCLRAVDNCRSGHMKIPSLGPTCSSGWSCVLVRKSCIGLRRWRRWAEESTTWGQQVDDSIYFLQHFCIFLQLIMMCIFSKPTPHFSPTFPIL